MKDQCGKYEKNVSFKFFLQVPCPLISFTLLDQRLRQTILDKNHGMIFLQLIRRELLRTALLDSNV